MGSYGRVPEARRQVCWAHLKRDFRKAADRGGAGAEVGRAGLRVVKEVFATWHAFKAGEATRGQLEARLAPVAARANRALVKGLTAGDPAVAAFCGDLLNVERALCRSTLAQARVGRRDSPIRNKNAQDMSLYFY